MLKMKYIIGSISTHLILEKGTCSGDRGFLSCWTHNHRGFTDNLHTLSDSMKQMILGKCLVLFNYVLCGCYSSHSVAERGKTSIFFFLRKKVHF